MTMPLPAKVLELIERFDTQSDVYRSPAYDEAQLRVDFVDHVLQALGWDVDNAKGYSEAFREVVHEDALKSGGTTKSPDYALRIGGHRFFFLEAKKPSVSIREDVAPAFQLRSYAWTAKLPLSILTNFAEFALYDCRVKPKYLDKASTARLWHFTYKDYPERWDQIAEICSPEGIQRGAYDRFVKSQKKSGTQDFDDAFLDEMEEWRKRLAVNLALRNPGLDEAGLNFATQRIIDRIVFLRICEDRGIETPFQLQGLIAGDNTYARLREFFRKADERYNSGLFHFQKERDRHESPDELTPGLAVDDDALKQIIKRLYYPDGPYVFKEVPADILGNVYERFLGNVIRLTAGHHAKVEPKPEVRKAGGVYYTPTYIVDYIAENTVGTLLKGKTPVAAAKLRILDPACGSGSFLLGAYQYLLDWHQQWYVANDRDKWCKGKNPTLRPDPRGEFTLTIRERKRILADSIYGVDLDPQAVEVTKLSLLLKCLEGESGQSIDQLRFFHERALPDLGDNVKCGNSLIGTDICETDAWRKLCAEQQSSLRPFDWEREFPATMKSGGFDAVIGNPPYVRQETIQSIKPYLQTRYAAFHSVADLYAYFMERGIRLLRDGGDYGIIVSSSFLRTDYGVPLRQFLKDNAAVLRIVDFGGLAVFADAKDTYVCIPLLRKGPQRPKVEVCRVTTLDFDTLAEHAKAHTYRIPHDRLSAEAWSLKSDAEAATFRKILRAGRPLGEYVESKMFYGVKTGLNDAFVITAEQRRSIISGCPAARSVIKPLLSGEDIRRYFIRDEARHLIVLPSGWTSASMLSEGAVRKSPPGEREAWNWLSASYPTIASHLDPFAQACRKRQDQGEFWWELRSCDYYASFESPKLIFPDIAKGPRFYLDTAGYYLANTAYCLGTGDPYLLALLNSKLFWFAIGNISIPFGVRAGQYRYRLIYQYMEKVPIRPIDSSKKEDKDAHDRVVSLADRMLALHQSVAAAQAPADKEALQRQMDATDRQIDRLVYDLYGLTDDEVRIVEEAAG